MIRIEFLLIYVSRKQVWGKCFHEELCAIGTAKKRKEKKMKKKKNNNNNMKSMKKSWKVEKKSFKVLFVEVRVQNNEFGPKELFKSPPCVLKLTSAF